MNTLLRKLSGGDLRSDGSANEVAGEVVRNPQLFEQLLEGLGEPDDVVRARTVHALEKYLVEIRECFVDSCRNLSVCPRATASQ